MKKKEKPLPRPPKTPFGRKRAVEKEESQELLADKMAEAAALGSLDRFLDRELPDSEHARALAKMMMGMTGMMPQAGGPQPAEHQEPAAEPSENAPQGVREAAQAGDVKGLIDLLRQEHLKRSGGDAGSAPADPSSAVTPAESPPTMEQETLDKLITLAREHDVTPDWIIMRALKLYFEEYKRTGRL